ncbi:hypothetical protein [Sphingobium nicotianae]|uniref:Beta-3-deoxy-D-manno-oct-2-ulosonic acid transferase n=1 Tax=Sphingobium nicotianae TaxID=2782607 RepID=A0A9X1IRK5_9SPHN|nr:hypothetical protein [Sphingobium nicotianae]MBT2187528.1 hypothetical protein [Sphingobium nicotianae]
MSAIARAIFAVPPFPGAKGHEVVRATPGTAPDISPGALVAAMRRHRAGGSFWHPDDVWSARDTPVEAAGDDSRLLLGAIAGRPALVRGDGAFAALHELTPGSAEAERTIETLVLRHLLEDVAYADPFTGAPVSPLALIETLGGWRALIEANRPIGAAFGFAHWKRDTVDPLLWAGTPVPFRAATGAALRALPQGASVAVWKARVPASFLAELEAGPRPILEVEDGFIRSAGLGADCVPPLSIIVDDLGVHYDPARPNRLTRMLGENDPSPDDLARAGRLRDWLVREGVSKYGIGTGTPLPREGGDRRHLLVVGQVEDDRSMIFGGGEVRTNLQLLQRVRAQAPDAWIVYRPHPDVEAGHRRGAIPARTALDYADAIDPASPISALIAMVDEVHVITSLAGFEALLQGKAVTTHGTPFFAGWGLTRDLGAPPAGRGKALSLDALVAAVLLRYPRYLDPVTNLPCTAEILTMRLLSGVQRQNVALVPLRRLVGWAKRAAAQFVGMR